MKNKIKINDLIIYVGKILGFNLWEEDNITYSHV